MPAQLYFVKVQAIVYGQLGHEFMARKYPI